MGYLQIQKMATAQTLVQSDAPRVKVISRDSRMKMFLACCVAILGACSPWFVNGESVPADFVAGVTQDRSFTIVFRGTFSEVRATIEGRLTSLMGPVSPVWRTNFNNYSFEPKSSANPRWRILSPLERHNLEIITNTTYELTWTPPAFDTGLISRGGKWIPLPSEIWLTVGQLRENPSVTFVEFLRLWRYQVSLHIPYTGIPSGRSKSLVTGLYRHDYEWLNQMTNRMTVVGRFTNQTFFSEVVVSALRK